MYISLNVLCGVVSVSASELVRYFNFVHLISKVMVQSGIVPPLILIIQLELGNITILSYIVILKCHDNRYRRDFFSIVISPMQYYRYYRGYRTVNCFKPCKFYVITI